MSYQLKIAMLIVLWFFSTEGTAQNNSVEPDSLFAEGRRLFALSIEDKEHIHPAVDLFKKISKDDRRLHDRALAYLGGLYTIKAKHAFFPFDKLRLAKKGLSILDEALSQSPDDIEVLFVHGTICHNLPGLFKRHDDARRDFNKIIELLPEKMHQYDRHFIMDVLDFLNNEIDLNKEEQKVIKKINSNL